MEETYRIRRLVYCTLGSRTAPDLSTALEIWYVARVVAKNRNNDPSATRIPVVHAKRVS